MFRPTGFADLAGRRVGIFGYGLEGRTAERLLVSITNDVVIVDDATTLGDHVIPTHHGGLDALLNCDVVLKSPGIPRRRPDVVNLDNHGVYVTSALNLWLQEVDRSRVVAITGTKGKSTVTALITFFLHCLGEPAHRLGNIGQPPYDPALDLSSGWLVLETSSFQCVDIEYSPGVVVLTSLGSDHLDWHGDLDQYQRDKLSLTNKIGDHVTVLPNVATFRGRASEIGGDLHFVDPDASDLAESLHLLGHHSHSNVAVALEAVATLTQRPVDDVRAVVRANAASFEPLTGRLTLVAREVHDGHEIRYVDDGLATSVLPVVAALEVFAHEPVALIAGGFDRGVDYAPLAQALATRRSQTTLLVIGPAGERIGALTRDLAPGVTVVAVADMREATAKARQSLNGGGVVLLSPGAPSFDQYENWEARSTDFHRQVRALTS